MVKLYLMILLTMSASMMCSCSSGNNVKGMEGKKVEVREPDKLVARVASVNREANYVLIQRYGRLVVPEDSILYTLGPGDTTANIQVTGERLGQFLAADISSGELNVGDSVYLRKFEKKQ